MPALEARSNEERRFRLLFLDIDGTLVGEQGTMSDRVHEAVRRAQEAGCTLVLCTGRSRYAAQKVAAQVGGKGFGIVLNGALVFDWETGEILRQALLPKDIASQAAEISHRQKMAPVWLGTEEQNTLVYTDRQVLLWPAYERRNRERIVYLDNLLLEMPCCPASLAAYGIGGDAECLAQKWRQAFGQAVHSVAGPTAVYEAWYAQLTAADADKGKAAEAVASRLGIPREETLAIGDHANDVSLLRWAALGVCMADGHPGALAAADYVTGTFAQDGAADALEQFILSRK